MDVRIPGYGCSLTRTCIVRLAICPQRFTGLSCRALFSGWAVSIARSNLISRVCAGAVDRGCRIALCYTHAILLRNCSLMLHSSFPSYTQGGSGSAVPVRRAPMPTPAVKSATMPAGTTLGGGASSSSIRKVQATTAAKMVMAGADDLYFNFASSGNPVGKARARVRDGRNCTTRWHPARPQPV